jgi:hypothetical protein
MQTDWIKPKDLESRLIRNDAFWLGELEDFPLMWITAPRNHSGTPPKEPDDEQKIWTDVSYYLEKAEYDLSHTHYAGDSLPVCHPWLGPDQFSAWLGAAIQLKPKEFTSWVKPFVTDWRDHPTFEIDPCNRWWQLYLELICAAADYGKDKWITAYPDLHTGIDALAAMRGPENLMNDIIMIPDLVHRAMQQMTGLWKYVVDCVADIIEPYGQGSSNWTMGWSSKKYLCIGQNDFSCLISADMFKEFCQNDNVECCKAVDYSLYHLDGPDAIRHLPTIIGLKNLTAVQWIPGAGNPEPSQWLELLQRIQQTGKSVQVWYDLETSRRIDMLEEIEVLCQNLDVTRLFIFADVESVEKADGLVKHVQKVC